MKQIRKMTPPEAFEEWKRRFKKRRHRKPNYDDLTREPAVKDALKSDLLAEQGYICCYCMAEIDPEHAHIEHFIPRNLTSRYPERDIQLGYDNLFASCCGENDRRDHCGHKKEGHYDTLLLCPTEEGIEQRFQYDLSGEIKGIGERAEKTVETLALNCYALRRHRAAAIWASGLFDEDYAQNRDALIQLYSEKDAMGRYTPFCEAIVCVLRNV